jgi:hypothetical protein
LRNNLWIFVLFSNRFGIFVQQRPAVEYWERDTHYKRKKTTDYYTFTNWWHNTNTRKLKPTKKNWKNVFFSLRVGLGKIKIHKIKKSWWFWFEFWIRKKKYFSKLLIDWLLYNKHKMERTNWFFFLIKIYKCNNPPVI